MPRGKRNGNGNGNRGTEASTSTAKSAKVEKARTFSNKSEDVPALTRLLFFFIQLGYETVTKILEQMKTIGAYATPATVSNALRTMKDKKLLTEDVRPSDGGSPEQYYKVLISDISFSGLSMEHILLLEKKLEAHPAAKKLAEAMPTGRRIKDYYRLFLLVRQLTPFYGAHPLNNPMAQKLYERSPYKCEDLDLNQKTPPLMLQRAEMGGAIFIHKAVVRNWLAELAQVSNLATGQDTLISYIFARHIYIKPNQPLTWVSPPVPGVGMPVHEVLLAGNEFQIVVEVPTSQIPLKAWVDLIAKQDGVSKHSLSPGRGSQTGDIEILKIDAQPNEPDAEGKRPWTNVYRAPDSVLSGEIPNYMLGEIVDPYAGGEEEPEALSM